MTSTSRIPEALHALEQHDRELASNLIAAELRTGEPTGQQWRSVYKLASKIGEIDMACEASRRVAFTPPVKLTSLITHCSNLTRVGRSDEATTLLGQLPEEARQHPAILHFYGTVASENGQFEKAEQFFRSAIAAAPAASDSWYAIAMAKTFESGDPDLAAMAAIEHSVERTTPALRSRYYYAMAKSLVDIGDVERGFAYYAKGAALRQMKDGYDRAYQEKMADSLIHAFTKEAMTSLVPSRFTGQRALIVNGLPRSGTTMVESILCSHSQVSDGAEVNVAKAALIPTRDRTFAGALAYQQHSDSPDPWGRLAMDYHYLLGLHFPNGGLVVDKTLSQSYMMGLLLHMMPAAKVLWLRRRPEDVALSAYRTYFTSAVRWSWSWEDIAHQMKIEDRLYEHWTELFPDRIMTIPYEKLVLNPEVWIPAMLNHVGLANEPQVMDFHECQRKVRTASARQVRAPIHSNAVGKSEHFAEQLKPFRDFYYG